MCRQSAERAFIWVGHGAAMNQPGLPSVELQNTREWQKTALISPTADVIARAE